MRRHIVAGQCAVVLVGALCVGCSGGTASPDPLATAAPSMSTASVPTTDRVTTVPVTSVRPGGSAATTAVVTTVEPVATGSVPTGVAELSADGPWRRVDSAPGITTPGLVYELLPKLWVYLPTTEDVAHGITWTLTPQDVPVIEAYLHARLVFFEVTETNPFDLRDPGWAKWYTDGGASYQSILSERSERGEVLDRADGIVLRPTVLGDGRSATKAIVFDCMLDGSVWRLPNGSLGPGSTPGVVENGVSSVVEVAAGIWAINGVANQAEACK